MDTEQDKPCAQQQRVHLGPVLNNKEKKNPVHTTKNKDKKVTASSPPPPSPAVIFCRLVWLCICFTSAYIFLFHTHRHHTPSPPYPKSLSLFVHSSLHLPSHPKVPICLSHTFSVSLYLSYIRRATLTPLSPSPSPHLRLLCTGLRSPFVSRFLPKRFHLVFVVSFFFLLPFFFYFFC